jgi:CHAT domain-containing protein
VVASLWSVSDAATAELMKRFYRAILKDGLTPAAALRQAQDSLRRERRWSAPYFWAGFILQGDWN